MHDDHCVGDDDAEVLGCQMGGGMPLLNYPIMEKCAGEILFQELRCKLYNSTRA
jgi:hypothetical protein